MSTLPWLSLLGKLTQRDLIEWIDRGVQVAAR